MTGHHQHGYLSEHPRLAHKFSGYCVEEPGVSQEQNLLEGPNSLNPTELFAAQMVLNTNH